MEVVATNDQAGALLRDELADIDLLLEHGRRDRALKALDERGGAQQLVSDQYSGRYPFELLQNANDAALETGRAGRAHFELTETALIVADNGIGFGVKQVDAVCSLGRSSKGPGTSVGHKGLGFKAVGEITERPQILSEQASFQFDNRRLQAFMLDRFGALPPGQRFPVYAFPFPIAPEDLGDDAEVVSRLQSEGYTTVVRLPLRPDVSRDSVANHLTTHLLPRLLLFLRGVDHLELHGTDADFSTEVARHVQGDVEHAYVVTDGRSEEWLLYYGAIPTTASMTAPLGEAWKEVDRAEYAIAVPLDDEGQPRSNESLPLHVYFPTEERPGLRVAVHAQWVLGMDRRQLATTREASVYNQALLDAVRSFAAERVIPDLLDRTSASPASLAALMPRLEEPLGDGAGSVRARWIQAPADIAARAGHSVNVLMKVYAHQIDGHEQRNRSAVEAALQRAALRPTSSPTRPTPSGSDPGTPPTAR